MADALRCACGAVATRRLAIEEQDLSGTCAPARFAALLCHACAERLPIRLGLRAAGEAAHQARIRALERELDALRRTGYAAPCSEK